MAALKGVKTLDMVDGKITKVAYEGAEYERVEGEAKVGDLFLPRKGFHDMTAGSFYAIKATDPDGDAYFYDDGGWSGVICSDDYFPFRKKHTRLKVGDYAKVVDDSVQDAVTKGDFVKITEDDETTLPFKCDVVIGKSACGGYIWARESDLVLATEAEVKAAKEAETPLKVGDYAKVINNVMEYREGNIVKIAEGGSRFDFKVDFINVTGLSKFPGQVYGYIDAKDLTRATDAEVAEAKANLAPKFSIGDYAKVVGDTYYSDIVGGAIVKITDLADEEGDLRFELVGDGDYDYAKPSSLEKVSAEDADKYEEEASTKAKWAKIGRKVGEYKVGDIVAYDDPPAIGNLGFGEVTKDTNSYGATRIDAVDYRGDRYGYYLDPEKLTLITPVEARFDRS
ncbi:hypothetical protein [Bacillus pumilus]|uniref:hypothetical protein n=1 Tax=Bacillus pumilus TaxID=1408 RepID=UPI003D702DD9